MRWCDKLLHSTRSGCVRRVSTEAKGPAIIHRTVQTMTSARGPIEKWNARLLAAAFLIVPVFSFFIVFARRAGPEFREWLAAVMLGWGSLFIFVVPFTDFARRYQMRKWFVLLGLGVFLTGFGLPMGQEPHHVLHEILVVVGAVLALTAFAIMGRTARKLLQAGEEKR